MAFDGFGGDFLTLMTPPPAKGIRASIEMKISVESGF